MCQSWDIYPLKDIYNAIKFCQAHHFTDDNNLFHIIESTKMLNKLINYDMKNLPNWVNANKTKLNITKMELVIFKPKRKKLETEFKIKSNGKILFQKNSVKYLSLKADKLLNWVDHENEVEIKLKRAMQCYTS